jgi:formiminotetrahydrofolate cyclodeaminase
VNLIDLTMKDYLEVLQSDAPAPGGGSVSALAGAEGAALLLMVARLTLGKEKFAGDQEICTRGVEKAERLYEQLTAAIDADTEAFKKVSAAFKMPKETEEEKAARTAAIGAGTLESTKVPYGVMELCLSGLETAETMAGHSNPNTASDLGVAALNFDAGLRGAWLNVKINLPGIKDEALVKEFTRGGEEMIRKSEAVAQKVFREVRRSLKWQR